jgi:hypothetical protein
MYFSSSSFLVFSIQGQMLLYFPEQYHYNVLQTVTILYNKKKFTVFWIEKLVDKYTFQM